MASQMEGYDEAHPVPEIGATFEGGLEGVDCGGGLDWRPGICEAWPARECQSLVFMV